MGRTNGSRPTISATSISGDSICQKTGPDASNCLSPSIAQTYVVSAFFQADPLIEGGRGFQPSHAARLKALRSSRQRFVLQARQTDRHVPAIKAGHCVQEETSGPRHTRTDLWPPCVQ